MLKGITISKPFKGANQFDLEFETKKIMKSAPELFQRVKQSLGKDNSIPRDISEDSSLNGYGVGVMFLTQFRDCFVLCFSI
ncbi:hypothetical protein OUZ56_016584 [Daphnia magna]|uniref:Uncharacterized protein n=1 Tax=Daphnia magna TaxID=35525 RepID=A0ABR0AR05_9CRUS|nr:hypothetical protein OUZ56_016584 [Daphnia magna]